MIPLFALSKLITGDPPIGSVDLAKMFADPPAKTGPAKKAKPVRAKPMAKAVPPKKTKTPKK